MQPIESNPDFTSRVAEQMVELQTDIAAMSEFIGHNDELEIAHLAQELMRVAQITDAEVRHMALDRIARNWRKEVESFVETEINDEMEAEDAYRATIRRKALYAPKGVA